MKKTLPKLFKTRLDSNIEEIRKISIDRYSRLVNEDKKDLSLNPIIVDAPDTIFSAAAASSGSSESGPLSTPELEIATELEFAILTESGLYIIAEPGTPVG